VRHVFLINGHEANGATMKYASRRLWDHAGVKVWRLFYPDLGAVMAEHCESPTWHGIVHACEFETSLMLAVAPHLVDMSKAVREYPDRDRGYFQGGRPMGDLSESGVFGDATLATAEKGKAMLSIFVESMSRALRDICAES
jgi:creatinine amidohydrolase